MHEGEPDRDDEEEPVPVYMTSVGRADDVGLRGERMDAAEYIADMEERVGRRLSVPRSDTRSWRDGNDHTDPGFLGCKRLHDSRTDTGGPPGHNSHLVPEAK